MSRLCLKAAAALVLASPLALSPQLCAQVPKPPTPSAQFDAATVKPTPPVGGIPYAAFLGHPGGRVTYAGNVKMLIWFAYGLHDYQIAGGPDWIASDKFDITAVPPPDSPSRNLKLNTAEPTAEQRQMLQSLLRDRFGLQCHFEDREGEVYILTRGTKPLQLVAAAHPDSDPRGAVVIRGGEKGMVEDGEAFANNATGDYLAAIFSRALHMPVVNQTGITGAWDFHLDPVDPENQDMQAAAYSVVDRLGLKIKRARGPIQTLVIDHIDHPTEN
ncbi:MAG TPA: TIGR03435 family protein [Acidisoma sp.]|jgi:uncharacterized protein (TIGR03435 family)|nr:TIGR03435 family protein [Acidisoma sp.]